MYRVLIHFPSVPMPLPIFKDMNYLITFLLTCFLSPFGPSIGEQGMVSYYGLGNWHGDITANGERFNPKGQTCAHKQYEFGAILIVYSYDTGIVTYCRVNDRGPYDIVDGKPIVDNQRSSKRQIDLSVGVAKQIGIFHIGISKVRFLKIGEI